MQSNDTKDTRDQTSQEAEKVDSEKPIVAIDLAPEEVLAVKAYSLLTGFYFSVLQFSYFLLLQINVSSTYITYMTVVICWMTGALAGIWFNRINVLWVAAAGFVGFYVVVAMISYLPSSTSLLFFCIPGVVASGLWAGRFFLHALPWSKGTDSVFFYENNGFVVGIVMVFIGFTLFGSYFLKIIPLVCALLLTVGLFVYSNSPTDSKKSVF